MEGVVGKVCNVGRVYGLVRTVKARGEYNRWVGVEEDDNSPKRRDDCGGNEHFLPRCQFSVFR